VRTCDRVSADTLAASVRTLDRLRRSRQCGPAIGSVRTSWRGGANTGSPGAHRRRSPIRTDPREPGYAPTAKPHTH